MRSLRKSRNLRKSRKLFKGGSVRKLEFGLGAMRLISSGLSHNLYSYNTGLAEYDFEMGAEIHPNWSAPESPQNNYIYYKLPNLKTTDWNLDKVKVIQHDDH